MEITVKQLSETTVRATISIGSQALADAEAVATTKLSKSVKVPGFRAGKVPPSVAAKHVDPAALASQTMDDAISKAIAEAFVEKDIQAIDRPQVEVKKYVPSESLEFTAEVAVMPKITLGDYKKLGVKQVKIEVTESDVNEVITRMQAGFAEKKEVSRAAKDGDDVVIDFVGKKDDIAFDGGTATDYTLTLGSGQFIPGFEAQIEGHKEGDTFDVNVEFPKEYHAKDLAGQPVIFSVTLKKVTERVLPELNDEFAAKAGPFKTLAELKADITAELTKQKERENSDAYKDQLIQALVEKSEVPVPDILIDDQVAAIERDVQQNLMYRGMTVDAYVEAQGFSDIDDWKEKEVKPAATRRVQAGLVLAELSKAENMQLTEQEIDEHLQIHKDQVAKQPEALEQLSTPEARREVANHYLTEKTIDRLVQLNSKK